MRDHGRISMCGAISQYNATEAVPGPDNLFKAVLKRLSLRGFIIFDHYDLYAEYLSVATGWLEDGSISNTYTAVDGLDNGVGALLGLSRGRNIGKMLVRLSQP
jgi:NADPH-dependent curcumin reductase CurA